MPEKYEEMDDSHPNWDCIKLEIRPSQSNNNYSAVWACASASRICIMSSELCEKLGGQFSKAPAVLKDITAPRFSLPTASFRYTFGDIYWVEEEIGVSENLRKNAGVDFLASGDLHQFARERGLTISWSDLPPEDRPPYYPRPKGVKFVSFTDWSPLNEDDEGDQENDEEDEGNDEEDEGMTC